MHIYGFVTELIENIVVLLTLHNKFDCIVITLEFPLRRFSRN